MNKLRMFFLLLIMMVGVVACGGEATTAVSTPAPIATVDTEAIADLVLARLEEEDSGVAAETAVPVITNTSLAAADITLQETLVNLYQQANPAVVYIILPNIGSGSGFVYDTKGHIVTNYHVVAGGNEYEIVFSNGERHNATLVGSDIDSDLAVLKVEGLPENITPLSLADSAELAVGQLVVAIGNPFGEQGSMSMGIISALGRSLESQRTVGGGSYSLPEVIQTDTPINPGNSGGPLLNLFGQVVGINSAIESTTGTNSGVGFAIPVQAVAQIVPGLIENGRYSYPYMGASFDSELSLDEQQAFALPQTQGAYIISITPGSPADKAGLRAANLNTGRGGDLVIAIDGQPVNDFTDLNSYLVFNTAVGQTIELTVLRDGEEMGLSLTLGERP